MRPIAILQHESTQGPGVLRDHLDERGIAYRLISPASDGRAPVDAGKFGGIVVLGSDHSVNETLPWIADELTLLQDAVRREVPVLGHCFGAQMLARAMGARVTRNICPNIGWSPVWVTPPAQQRMALPRQATIFNWHYDTFEIPAGAVRAMYGSHCLNKGFLRGRHWAFQGHLEVTVESVRNWCAAGRAELLRAQGPAVQSEAQILSELRERIAALRVIADQTYRAWTAQLDRPILVAPGRAASWA
ncbi:type 1 glutamine amidotransferase [Herbaspirillum sp. WKF16]|jgi:GMP synthase-like glutamine amidotransferase|uniref:type 1 glutamine amidotransferase n=1 Tax=Herbaspirillum sp. WKF16 TaxID=3028312 RepID=UPI0023A9831A|nr:type 1 glutamine amidotransferase [Herbaspirillum sp. WKF16]WDZ94121.1 type 1 glutamine amidotransferase [Herbaspirillum sp. WKF16]